MTYYEQYKKMYPTPEDFAAVIERTPLDGPEDNISPRSSPFAILRFIQSKNPKMSEVFLDEEADHADKDAARTLKTRCPSKKTKRK
jgi:hypothetical protein